MEKEVWTQGVKDLKDVKDATGQEGV